MASPKSDSADGSPRDGVTKQNKSADSPPAEGPIVAQEENEGDARDSAFGDDASVSSRIVETLNLSILYRESSTASISSSILEYRKFQGRTFHSERYNMEYFTPNDEQQRDSIDITHHVLTLLLDGKLTLVPFKDDIQVGGPSGHRNTSRDTDKLKRVLDVGTGTVGCRSETDWCSDFADEYPNVEVIGTDLSPIQPSWVPPNVKFELEDATKDWSWPENHFDLVHVRFLMGAIADWGTLFKEASHCCRPGGFVESGEINPTFYSDDGSIDDVEALQTWNQLVVESGKGFGRSFTNIENDVQLFGDAGLVDVQSFDFKVPIGGWPKDEKMRKVGQFLRASIENDLEGYTMMVWHQVMNWPEDEYQVFLMNMRKAFKDKRIHGYMRVRYVYGQKTEVDKYLSLKDSLPSFILLQENLEEVSMFHERFCADEKQPIPLLQAWADLMKLTFKYWDPLVANFIVTASLNFLNINALEARKEFHQIERTKSGRSWAWFLREKDGVGEAYAWFTFPKALCPDISLFLEVVPDVSTWIGLTNDVLSAWFEDKYPQSVF
ncbi:hypothetical protein FAGAP_8212 [Fusarium agapanthi]|uniref:Methyltransferase n=1 Tax=Fusarium agapanthi TaxID=1803897 RepID=A0A9P5B6U6_9HYPO|nr:hypothetical protein FAGAP_8212 [Fusarium agapanthi]